MATPDYARLVRQRLRQPRRLLRQLVVGEALAQRPRRVLAARPPASGPARPPASGPARPKPEER